MSIEGLLRLHGHDTRKVDHPDGTMRFEPVASTEKPTARPRRAPARPALTDPFSHHVAHQAGLALGALAGVLVARGVRALWLRHIGAKG
ncbi:hypothetical protein [Nocardia farcinica]|uniref:hypothetical protein n=1 Tax=Nocardia farcinica TaxID=37329 RepID=UPI0024571E81|nr:hypothetical protein [Nocardia farcinica]